MRRDIAAIVAAIKMDPLRRELYVEGGRDRVFVRWITEGISNPHTRVMEAQFIKSPQASGGERGRLLHFALAIEGLPVPIRILIDADLDHLLGNPVPANVYRTDLRDTEGYFLREDCFEKLVQLGFGRGEPLGRELLAMVLATARPMGLLRFVSALHDLDLPFQDAKVQRYTTFNDAGMKFDFRRYLHALLQEASISLAELERIEALLAEATERFAASRSEEIVHGHDVIRLMEKVCQRHGVSKEAAEAILWCTFERAFVPDYAELSRVVGFVRGDTPIP